MRKIQPRLTGVVMAFGTLVKGIVYKCEFLTFKGLTFNCQSNSKNRKISDFFSLERSLFLTE